MYWNAGELNKLLFKLKKTGQYVVNYYENDDTEQKIKWDKKIEKPKGMELEYVYVGPDCYTDVYEKIDEKDIGKYTGFYEIIPISMPKNVYIKIILNDSQSFYQ